MIVRDTGYSQSSITMHKGITAIHRVGFETRITYGDFRTWLADHARDDEQGMIESPDSLFRITINPGVIHVHEEI